MYEPTIAYSYEVDGRVRTDDTYSIQRPPEFNSERQAWDFATRNHPIGSEIYLWYDPDDPGNVVVRRSPPDWESMRIGLFFAGVLAALAGLFFGAYRIDLKRDRRGDDAETSGG